MKPAQARQFAEVVRDAAAALRKAATASGLPEDMARQIAKDIIDLAGRTVDRHIAAVELAERDRKIVTALDSGVKPRVVAAAFQITRQRVVQIYQAHQGAASR